MSERPTGPWVKKLIVMFMSKKAIPPNGGLMDGVRFLKDPKQISDTAREATKLAFESIDAVRAAPDCEWETDEEIAEQIVTRIKAIKRT